MYSLSYSSMADIYAIAQEETGEERKELLKLATDLEQTGLGWYKNEEFIYRSSPYGMEVVSMADYQSEQEDDDA